MRKPRSLISPISYYSPGLHVILLSSKVQPGLSCPALGQPGAGLLALQSSLLRPTPQGAVSTGKLHSYGAGLQRVNDRVSNVGSPDPDPTTMKSLDAGNTLEAMPHSRRWRSEVSRGRATQTCLASS